jgi:hypothetical protein
VGQAQSGVARPTSAATCDVGQIFFLAVAIDVIYDLVGGQIGLEKVVDDGNLTAFIIRYRYRFPLVSVVCLSLDQSNRSIVWTGLPYTVILVSECALRSSVVVITRHVLRSMIKSEAKDDIEAEFLRISIGDSSNECR